MTQKELAELEELIVEINESDYNSERPAYERLYEWAVTKYREQGKKLGIYFKKDI